VRKKRRNFDEFRSTTVLNIRIMEVGLPCKLFVLFYKLWLPSFVEWAPLKFFAPEKKGGNSASGKKIVGHQRDFIGSSKMVISWPSVITDN
jgi:hypothetical protein